VVFPSSGILDAWRLDATLIGQGLSAEQMYTMRSLVDRASEAALADRISIASGPVE